jgi:ribose-phosphate pyrophosphokinase
MFAMTQPTSPAIFALDADKTFAAAVADALGINLAPIEDRVFPDGEYKVRPLSGVRGEDVYVVSSLFGDDKASSADKLCKLLFENAFRCETVPLDAQALFARSFLPEIGDAPVAVVAPDPGGDKRAELFRLRLEDMLGRPVGKAVMDKFRSEGRVTGDLFAGDVRERIAIIIDDLVAGGGTLARVATACRANGARAVWAAATHGVFTAEAPDILRTAPIDRLVTTNTVGEDAWNGVRVALGGRLSVIDAAPLFAAAIRRLHENGSIAELLVDGP